MGVEIEDAYHVASLIGTKVFADEFISFSDLTVMVCKREIKVKYSRLLKLLVTKLDSLLVDWCLTALLAQIDYIVPY